MLFDARSKLVKFINEAGSVPKASRILGYSDAHIYNMRDGKSRVSDEVLLRIENGGGELRTRSQVGQASAAARANGDQYRFDATADIATMADSDMVKFIDAIEKRIAVQRDIIGTAMEKARVATEEAEKRIPALLELGRKAVQETSRRQLKKFGGTVTKTPKILGDAERDAIAATVGNTVAVAEQYGVSVTTVKRIRRGVTQ